MGNTLSGLYSAPGTGAADSTAFNTLLSDLGTIAPPKADLPALPTIIPASPARQNLPRARTTPPALHDPQQYVRVPNVPVWDEHWKVKVVRDPETKQLKKQREWVSIDQVRTVCENTQKRDLDRRHALLLLGHIDENEKDETKLPKLLGYVSNFQMGLDDKDRDVMLADYHIEPQYAHLLKEYPRRSVEVFGKNTPHGFIDAVSIIKRAPERDTLGLVTHYAREPLNLVENADNVWVWDHYCSCRDGFDRYECPDCQAKDDGAEPSPRTGAKRMAIEAEDIHAIVAGVVKGMTSWLMEQSPEGADGMNDGGGGGAPPMPEEELEPEKNAAGGGPGAAPAAAASVPSGTNEPPMPEKDRDSYYRRKEIEIASIRTDNRRLQEALGKMGQRLKIVEKENTTTRERYQAAERRYQIERLVEEERLLANVDEEVEDTVGMDDARFQRHLERMKTNYARDHTRVDRIPLDRSPATRTENPTAAEEVVTIDPSEYDEIDRYARQNGIDVNAGSGGNIRAVNEWLENVKKPRMKARQAAGNARR